MFHLEDTIDQLHNSYSYTNHSICLKGINSVKVIQAWLHIPIIPTPLGRRPEIRNGSSRILDINVTWLDCRRDDSQYTSGCGETLDHSRRFPSFAYRSMTCTANDGTPARPGPADNESVTLFILRSTIQHSFRQSPIQLSLAISRYCCRRWCQCRPHQQEESGAASSSEDGGCRMWVCTDVCGT